MLSCPQRQGGEGRRRAAQCCLVSHGSPPADPSLSQVRTQSHSLPPAIPHWRRAATTRAGALLLDAEVTWTWGDIEHDGGSRC